MFTQTARVIRAADLPDTELEFTPLDPAQIISGEPTVRSLSLYQDDTLAIGIWQHSVGVSTDVEVDEVFVVLSGRATIELDDGATVQVSAGDVAVLPAGARTTWTIHETLRKVYLTHS